MSEETWTVKIEAYDDTETGFGVSLGPHFIGNIWNFGEDQISFSRSDVNWTRLDAYGKKLVRKATDEKVAVLNVTRRLTS